MRLAIGTFVLPFLYLGVSAAAVESVKNAPVEDRKKWPLSDDPEKEKWLVSARKAQEKADQGSATSCWQKYITPQFDSLTKMLTAQDKQLEELVEMEQAEGDKSGVPDGLEVGDSTIERYYTTVVEGHGKLKKKWCQVPIALMKTPFGFYDQYQIAGTHAADRSRMWQAQVEQTQKNNAKSTTLAMQLIPFIGVPLGKTTQYLNEHPLFLTTDDPKQAARSMRCMREKEEQGGQIKVKPSIRLGWLYFINVLKLVALALGYIYAYVLTATAVVYLLSLVEGVIDKKQTEYGQEGKLHGHGSQSDEFSGFKQRDSIVLQATMEKSAAEVDAMVEKQRRASKMQNEEELKEIAREAEREAEENEEEMARKREQAEKEEAAKKAKEEEEAAKKAEEDAEAAKKALEEEAAKKAEEEEKAMHLDFENVAECFIDGFKAYGTDENGYLTKECIQKAMQEMYPDGKSDEEISEMLAKVQETEDGKVDVIAFANANFTSM